MSVAAATIAGPAGQSHSIEAAIPPTTASTPTPAASAAMVSGVRAKLRDDQRELKAEFAALVSSVLPKDSDPIACVDNVWVSDYASAIGLASALRVGLIEAARSKQALVGRSEKMEVLYGYLSGPAFRNRIEGLLEPFQAMREDLEAERPLTGDH